MSGSRLGGVAWEVGTRGRTRQGFLEGTVPQRGLVDGPGTHGRGLVGAGGSPEPSGAQAPAFTDGWVRA